MYVEILVASLVLILTCLPLRRALPRRRILLPLLILVLAALGAVQWLSFQSRTLARVKQTERIAADLPRLERDTEYVSSNRCRSCHPAEHASWHRTYHRTMTQVALPENVAGVFDGTTVRSDGLEYRVFREEGDFWAEMPDPDVMMYAVQGGMKVDLEKIPRVRRRVVMTTGSHHYQTYWVGSERYPRLLQTLPLIYLIKDRRWIPREAAFMHPPEATRMITQWNHHCIRCHSTGGVPGLNKKTGMLESQVGELGIACEACHGPGEEHIRVNQDPVRRYRLHTRGEHDSTIVNPARLDHRASSQVCGQCHGVYIMRNEYGMKYAYEGTLYRPGDDLHRTRKYIEYPREGSTAEEREEFELNPAFFRERWWEDGTVLAGGREYTGLMATGCFTNGTMSCLTCHSMHESDPVDQLKPGMQTNRACVGCHDEPEYTTNVRRHTHHEPGTAGSNCLNCHMPHTTYALFSAIRTHQIAAPNLDGSIRYGVPNACNLCHLDKTLAWTQEHMADWYGHKPKPLRPEQQNVSAALLWLLKGHAAQRVIVAWHVGWQPAHEASGSDWLAPFQARLLADPYGVVRYVAEHNLSKLPGFEGFQYNFLASREELRRHADQAVARWNEQRPDVLSRTGSSILINRDGSVMDAQVRALLRQRDNRPVTIKE